MTFFRLTSYKSFSELHKLLRHDVAYQFILSMLFHIENTLTSGDDLGYSCKIPCLFLRKIEDVFSHLSAFFINENARKLRAEVNCSTRASLSLDS